ncbi:MAG: hypothetical protein U9O82_14115 [Thermodesulfobacteriota bacterium]|nr:hypothetical protein [Thermodesulfobacteriota bacterium]
MNLKRLFLIPLCCLAVSPFFPGNCPAGDLDDGISKFTDESIEKDYDLGNPDKNIKFIIMKAKSQAAMGEKKGDDATQGATGSGNMNSVVLGPGSNIKGDIIILDQSKGDKTQVVQ